MEDSIAVNEAVSEEQAAVVEAAPQKKQKKPINQAKLQDNLWGWIFCVPLIIGTVWFVYVCLILAFLLSFTDYTILKGDMFQYVGEMGQHIHPQGAFYWYKDAFTHAFVSRSSGVELTEIWLYLFNTVFYMIGIPIGMVLSMFFAVCMSRDIKGGNVFRVLYYLPCVASTVSIVFTFKLMFSRTGVINGILGLNEFQWINLNTGTADLDWNTLTGQASTSTFMREPFWCQGLFTKLVIIIMSVWKGLGGTIILYIAGLSGVNAATKEAAQIDGANGWKIFWKVTMPDLYPVIFYNIVTSVIGGMQIYAEPELFIQNHYITSGYVALIWAKGLDGANPAPSQGAAYGMILAVIIFVLTMFQFWLDSRNKD